MGWSKPCLEILSFPSPMLPQLLVFHLSNLLLHTNMDAFSVSLHDFLLSTPVIPLALSSLHMEWTCEKLVLPSILLTDFNKFLVLRSYASLILSSHGTVSSHRNACFVAADQMTMSGLLFLTALSDGNCILFSSTKCWCFEQASTFHTGFLSFLIFFHMVDKF